MKTILSLSLAAATVFGAAALPAAAAVAAPSRSTAASPLVLVSGWASRVEGKRGTYDDSFEGYGVGAYPYQPYARGYGEPAYGHGAVAPYGYGGEDDGYADDLGAY